MQENYVSSSEPPNIYGKAFLGCGVKQMLFTASRFLVWRCSSYFCNYATITKMKMSKTVYTENILDSLLIILPI